MFVWMEIWQVKNSHPSTSIYLAISFCSRSQIGNATSYLLLNLIIWTRNLSTTEQGIQIYRLWQSCKFQNEGNCMSSSLAVQVPNGAIFRTLNHHWPKPGVL
jgi:hypothetical protein